MLSAVGVALRHVPSQKIKKKKIEWSLHSHTLTHNELELSSTQALNLIKKCILYHQSTVRGFAKFSKALSGQNTGTKCNQEQAKWDGCVCGSEFSHILP